MDADICKYVPFKTLINASFWYKLTNIKLDIDRLTEARTHIWASYSNIQQKHEIPFLEIDCTSFNSEFQEDTKYLPCHGFVLNKNTVESFKDCDKLGLIDEEGSRFLEHFKCGRIFDDPSLLNTFFILAFADLKKYHYYFWFAFPTPSNFNVLEPSAKPAQDVFNPDQMSDLLSSYHNLSYVNRTFFVVLVGQSNTLTILTLSAFKVEIMGDANSIDVNSVYFGFSDPCVGSNPGWPMRNYMAFLYYCCPQIRGRTINVLSLRLSFAEQSAVKYSCQTSLVLRVLLPEVEDCLFAQGEAQSKWIGWQKNERGNFGPKVVDMSSSMDPTRMMENSVDLNLKLMKWRLLPNIDLDRIKNTKCLLMGAGTLGCSVARSLLAWGVRHISFVDNGKVSYSNPVRQSLYTHADCVLGIAKVVAAAASLKTIFPAVVSTGTQITIPMPGHSIGESLLRETQDSVATLNELISGHDVVFLLTDSRESRWLPTLLAAHHQKIVINAALGFDTYLVMRHGFKSDADVVQQARILTLTPGVRSISGRDLGCYFCNDITAPGDSMKDRTLDQQCTVTRPGVSAIAGALAAELAISILQHPSGPDAPAYYNSTNDTPDLNSPDECMLGIIPHSIRGFLSTFSHVLPATEHYQKCIACSPTVLEAYAKHGFAFLLQAFNSSKYLEDLTGLTELHQESDAAVIWEMSSSDEESDCL